MQLDSFRMLLLEQIRRPGMGIEQVGLLTAAMDRIAAGTFGRCVRCHGGIGAIRLAALPHARFCIPCQEIGFHKPDPGNTDRWRFIEEGGNDV